MSNISDFRPRSYEIFCTRKKSQKLTVVWLPFVVTPLCHDIFQLQGVGSKQTSGFVRRIWCLPLVTDRINLCLQIIFAKILQSTDQLYNFTKVFRNRRILNGDILNYGSFWEPNETKSDIKRCKVCAKATISLTFYWCVQSTDGHLKKSEFLMIGVLCTWASIRNEILV